MRGPGMNGFSLAAAAEHSAEMELISSGLAPFFIEIALGVLVFII